MNSAPPSNSTAPVKPPAKGVLDTLKGFFGSKPAPAVPAPVVSGGRRKNTRKQNKKSRKTRSNNKGSRRH
jgi:hypothetical protein